MRATQWGDATLCFHLTEASAVRSNGDITGQHHFYTHGKSNALYSGNNGFRATFAEAEGIALDLIAAPSWSSVRDMLAFSRVDAAHLLSPLPVAMAMGLGGMTTALSAGL